MYAQYQKLEWREEMENLLEILEFAQSCSCNNSQEDSPHTEQ